MEFSVPTVTIDDLCAFHATHFPHVVLPDQFLHGAGNMIAQDHAEPTEEYFDVEPEDDLGYYPDGAKRTLTDEQIAIFRHSEIREILRERRSRYNHGDRSEGEVSGNELASADLPPHGHGSPKTTCAATSTGNAYVEDLKQKHSGPGEESKVQRWATSSARTKRRNKRNRDKYHAKKRAEREKEQGPNRKDSGDESDEWDPWHQATGPDAQKEEVFDLDY
ncbi:hypothetical protein IAQ61_004464 [Plenodomus lingam]|nr:hypothetical protein IAQ61_004464 [Plenodomus lingam]